MRSQSGFTLLEVMIALAVLATSILVIVNAQNQGLILKGREERLIVATGLARVKMGQKELEIEEEGWGSLEDDEEKCEDFSEDFTEGEFKDYEWCWKLKKVELTLPSDAFQGGAPEVGDGGEVEGNATANLAGSAGIDIGSGLETLSKGIRLLHVRVKWKTGEKTEESVELSTHLVNLKQSSVL